jgi:hypothetical protein
LFPTKSQLIEMIRLSARMRGQHIRDAVVLRRWLGTRNSLDFGSGVYSELRWTSKEPNGDPGFSAAETGSTTMSELPRWERPDTWRLVLSVGYTHTIADAVTLHLAVAAQQNLLFQGEIADPSKNLERLTLLGFGGVQVIGLRHTPLIRVHLRDWFALNFNASVSYDIARRFTEETYDAGASFVW